MGGRVGAGRNVEALGSEDLLSSVMFVVVGWVKV
jgi:hypothetical protein